MIKQRLGKSLIAASSVLLAQGAWAGVSATVTLTSDYVFDGVSQTQEDPAVQASLDYGHESGFYAGTWASNVDFGEDDPADFEVDVYAGFAAEIEEGLGYDFGLAQYMYTGAPSDGYDYMEVYAGFYTPMDFSLYGWLADDDDIFGGKNVRIKGVKGFSINDDFRLEAELTYIDALDVDEGDSNYIHYRLGVSTSLEIADLDLSYHNTDIDDNDNAEGRVVLTATRTFDF